MATCNRHELNYGNRDLCPACRVEAVDRTLGYIGGIRLRLKDAAKTARASLEERANAMKEVDAIRDRHRTTCPVDRAPDKDNEAVRLEDEYIRR